MLGKGRLLQINCKVDGQQTENRSVECVCSPVLLCCLQVSTGVLLYIHGGCNILGRAEVIICLLCLQRRSGIDMLNYNLCLNAVVYPVAWYPEPRRAHVPAPRPEGTVGGLPSCS